MMLVLPKAIENRMSSVAGIVSPFHFWTMGIDQMKVRRKERAIVVPAVPTMTSASRLAARRIRSWSTQRFRRIMEQHGARCFLDPAVGATGDAQHPVPRAHGLVWDRS